jgi:hypothetical protein
MWPTSLDGRHRIWIDDFVRQRNLETYQTEL